MAFYGLAVLATSLLTINRPEARNALTPRMLCALADGVDEIERHGASVSRLQLIGGGAQSPAVRKLKLRIDRMFRCRMAR